MKKPLIHTLLAPNTHVQVHADTPHVVCVLYPLSRPFFFLFSFLNEQLKAACLGVAIVAVDCVVMGVVVVVQSYS